jgi:hypothetical protein
MIPSILVVQIRSKEQNCSKCTARGFPKRFGLIFRFDEVKTILLRHFQRSPPQQTTQQLAQSGDNESMAYQIEQMWKGPAA